MGQVFLSYTKKPVAVRAAQWWNLTDLPSVVTPYIDRIEQEEWESLCNYCQEPYDKHGWITTMEGGHIVCPSDYVIEGVQGEYYPCKETIFKATYDRNHPPE